MKNPRITDKEWALVKGALRRVFSRSDLRRKIVEASRVKHFDPERPRVTKWSRCAKCNLLSPTYTVQVDHIEPIKPTKYQEENYDLNSLLDLIWCNEENLQVLDDVCHKIKSKAENALRRLNKKGKK